MGITYKKFKESISGPVINCDICGEQIIKYGNVLHAEDDYSKIVFVHKGACDRAFQNIIEKYYSEKYGNLFGWTDIDRFLYILMNNAGIDYEKAKNNFRDLADYGFAHEGKGYKDKDIDVKKETVEIDDRSIKKLLENLLDEKIDNEHSIE